MEPLAYYFNLKPDEFWNCTYREINLFCQSNLIREEEKLKQIIIVQDITTDKIIQANPFNKNPKVVPLRKKFDKLFKK